MRTTEDTLRTLDMLLKNLGHPSDETDPELPAETAKPAETATPPARKPAKPYPVWIATEGPAMAIHTLNTYLAPHLKSDAAPINPLLAELRAQVNAVNTGNMASMEELLVAQAYTLTAIFNRLATRAQQAPSLTQFALDLKLALRAQNQCRATIETLSTIKNPPNVAFVKQANIAHNQQVNNGTRAGSPVQGQPPAIDQTPQLEHPHGNTLDTRTPETALGNHLDTGTPETPFGNEPDLATVGEIHRPEDRQGQG